MIDKVGWGNEAIYMKVMLLITLLWVWKLVKLGYDWQATPCGWIDSYCIIICFLLIINIKSYFIYSCTFLFVFLFIYILKTAKTT